MSPEPSVSRPSNARHACPSLSANWTRRYCVDQVNPPSTAAFGWVADERSDSSYCAPGAEPSEQLQPNGHGTSGHSIVVAMRPYVADRWAHAGSAHLEKNQTAPRSEALLFFPCVGTWLADRFGVADLRPRLRRALSRLIPPPFGQPFPLRGMPWA
jgi:hypothetical protein